jgi:hypothetical protein
MSLFFPTISPGRCLFQRREAIKYDGIRCPDNSPAGCAASIAGFITSVTWKLGVA